MRAQIRKTTPVMRLRLRNNAIACISSLMTFTPIDKAQRRREAPFAEADGSALYLP